MSMFDTVAFVVHQVFGALWVGAVVFVAIAVLPLGTAGDLSPDVLDLVVDRLVTLSRASATLILLSGLWLVNSLYLGGEADPSPLVAEGRGHLVLTMVALWVVLMATLEIGSSKLRDGLDRDKLREPAREALPWYRVAAAAGLAVTVIAGLLTSGFGN